MFRTVETKARCLRRKLKDDEHNNTSNERSKDEPKDERNTFSHKK